MAVVVVCITWSLPVQIREQNNTFPKWHFIKQKYKNMAVFPGKSFTTCGALCRSGEDYEVREKLILKWIRLNFITYTSKSGKKLNFEASTTGNITFFQTYKQDSKIRTCYASSPVSQQAELAVSNLPCWVETSVYTNKILTDAGRQQTLLIIDTELLIITASLPIDVIIIKLFSNTLKKKWTELILTKWKS